MDLEAALSACLSSAAYTFVDFYGEEPTDDSEAHWRRHFGGLCHLFARHGGDDDFAAALDIVRLTLTAKLEIRLRGDRATAEFIVAAPIALADRATAAAREVRAKNDWQRPVWDVTASGNIPDVSAFDRPIIPFFRKPIVLCASQRHAKPIDAASSPRIVAM